jgi:peptidoglycan hydrolase-like protein with peptidoglycan-binding domain
MHRFMTVLLVSVLWLCPMMTEAGTAGESGVGQQKIITKDNLKVVQERLKAEGVYAGSVDGEMNAETEAALRQYQQKQGIPVSGMADEETLKQLQVRLPASSQGETQ